MSLGSRIRELRRARGLTQAQLGEMVGAEGNTVSRWELDRLGMRKEYVVKFAQALDTSADFLLEETDNPARSSQGSAPKTPAGWLEAAAPGFTPFNLSKFNMSVTGADLKGLKKLPILRGLSAADAGAKNPSGSVDGDIASWQIFSADIYGTFDPRRPPFAIRVEGDGMEGADIHDGAVAVINPAEEVRDGEAALVCWGRAQAAIKLVYWREDGGAELHSANPRYLKVYAFTKEDLLAGSCVIRGKVMWSGQRPRRIR